jgi:ribosomal protein S12 methylthiotransferase accessory factor
MSGLGISRVSDITRMDRLGLPVYASIRPRGRALRVHAGKGLQAVEAKVGALMEAVEFTAAEPQNNTWTSRLLTLRHFVEQFGGRLGLSDFAPIHGARVEPDHVVSTVECEEVRGDRNVFLPGELIFVPYPPDGETFLFGWTTNGLASGNSLEEATLHALLEVLERDAIAINKPRDCSLLVLNADLPPPFDEIESYWRRCGIELSVRYVPNAFELPCFQARLHEAASTDVNLAAGSGLHLDRQVALARAICEAAQSRLTHIHGGRDDVTDFYSKYNRWPPRVRTEMEAKAVRNAFDSGRNIDFETIPEGPNSDKPIAKLLDGLLDRLFRLGFESVFRYRFDLDSDDLCVVKIVVPRCEHVGHGALRMGTRLLRRVVGDA